MDKEDYLRLLEKVIETIPSYLLGTAAMITALNSSKKKKRQPKSRKRKR